MSLKHCSIIVEYKQRIYKFVVELANCHLFQQVNKKIQFKYIEVAENV